MYTLLFGASLLMIHPLGVVLVSMCGGFHLLLHAFRASDTVLLRMRDLMNLGSQHTAASGHKLSFSRACAIISCPVSIGKVPVNIRAIYRVGT